MAEKRVEWHLDDAGVAHVQLARAERMNALDAAMFEAILGAQQALAAARGLRAVVLSGQGKAFCAGLDMATMKSIESGPGSGGSGAGAGGVPMRLAERTHGIANAPQQVVWGWRALEVPVIAALHGVAYGGGLQIALAADLRFAAPATQLSVMEIEWGLVPDMAGMALLRELVRGDVMRDLVLSGRVVAAEEAQALGLVSRVCADPLAQAQAYAAQVAQRNPHAVRAAKRLLNRALQGDTPAAVLLAEAVEQQRIIGSANQREAIRAKLGQRAPQFEEVGEAGAAAGVARTAVANPDAAAR